MRRVLWLVCVWLAASCVVLAQPHSPSRSQLGKAVLPASALTLQEGEAILAAAADRQTTDEDQPDCSHLTYDVYTRAGFPYPYARSIDLYAGIKGFVRVRRPQPGDLIVWRGHVGLVVDPVEHTFYSSLRSGLKTDFYDSPAWMASGAARFYRYAVAMATEDLLSQFETRPANRRTAGPFLTIPTLADFREMASEVSHSAAHPSEATRATLDLPGYPTE
jgi:hypothetical protein